MKLKFIDQQFQTDAVGTVVKLFAGQEKNQATFSIVEEKQATMFNDLGVGNSLLLDDNALLANMHSDTP
jgi:type III restriction enzyme